MSGFIWGIIGYMLGALSGVFLMGIIIGGKQGSADDELNLINCQKANYESLKEQEERAHQYCKNICEPKYKAEIERLKTVKGHIDTLIHRDCEYPTEEAYNEAFQKALEHLYDNVNVKAEAYKEFANELKCRTHEISYNTMQVVNKDDIDNLLKELKGE